MTLDELRKGNRVAIIAVSLTALTICLTILVKVIVEGSGNTQRIVALERAVQEMHKEVQIIQADVKSILRKE